MNIVIKLWKSQWLNIVVRMLTWAVSVRFKEVLILVNSLQAVLVQSFTVCSCNDKAQQVLKRALRP